MKNGAAHRLAPKRRVHYRQPAARSTLAARAIEGRAATLDEPPDRPAAAARPTLAIIDREGLGEVAELAVGAGEILERRAAGRDRFVEHVADRRNQPLEPPQRDRAPGPLGMDAGAVQRLAHVDVAAPGHDPLAEQQQLYRRGTAGEPALKLARVEVERLGPERLERRPVLELVRSDQVERAEAARIVERYHPAVIGLKDEVIVLADRARIDPPVSRHAEVEHQSVAAVGVDQAVFGTAAKPAHPRP